MEGFFTPESLDRQPRCVEVPEAGLIFRKRNQPYSEVWSKFLHFMYRLKLCIKDANPNYSGIKVKKRTINHLAVNLKNQTRNDTIICLRICRQADE